MDAGVDEHCQDGSAFVWLGCSTCGARIVVKTKALVGGGCVVKGLTVLPLSVLLLTAILAVRPGHAQSIPAEIKSVVAYIFKPRQDTPPTDPSKDLYDPNGTGFFVGVEHPSKDRSYVYLVTAKHVVLKENGKGFYNRIGVRINKKNGKSELVGIPLTAAGSGKNLFVHPDATVDLAVIPFAPNGEYFDHKFLPDTLVTSREDVAGLKITEGSEVFFTGLFVQHIGDEKNHPIVRFGRVALMTEERIRWNGDTRVQVYLVESASYGGNSGSPVFFFLGPEREPGSFTIGGRVLRLAGVMQGTFNDIQPVRVIDTARVPVSLASNGIAAVVPAYKLREILFGQELKTLRGF